MTQGIERKVFQPGSEGRSVLERETRFLSPTMSAPTGLVWDRARGSEMFDPDGNRYIDFSSGVLVTNTGHCHKEIVRAVQQQVAKLINCYDSPHPLRAELAERLLDVMPDALSRVLFLSTGAEAIEAAVKIARRATGRSEIIGFQGGFHGRTYMAMAVGGITGVKRGFGPHATGVLHAPYPYPYRCDVGSDADHDCTGHCLASLERLLRTESEGDVAAVVIEPYQGAAGSLIAPREFARGIRQMCDEHDILMIVDEVQSGFGRTGTLFAFEQWDLTPDIVVLGKGIASGLPMSAVVATSELFDSLPHGSLSSTYGGNPVSCAAGIATLDVMVDEQLPERARTLGARATETMNGWTSSIPLVGDVRGMGLAIGIELVRSRKTKEPAPEEANLVVQQALARGLAVISPIGLHGNVLRIAPPLTIDDRLLDEGLDLLRQSLEFVDNR